MPYYRAKKVMDAKAYIELLLKAENIPYQKEYKFLTDRKFRADFFLPEYDTIIEYEGIMSQKSRHTSVVGYSKDSEKYNLAQLAGFKVLRYTTLNYKDLNIHLKILKDQFNKVILTHGKEDK